MARQISVSDEVYGILFKVKGRRSFSEVIKDALEPRGSGRDIMRFAGALKGDKRLKELKELIEKDRERNYGRSFSW